jgi:iron complex outermembrane recepter protein
MMTTMIGGRSTRSKLMAGAALGIVALMAGQASAQPAQTASSELVLEEIVVTGTRIQRPGLTSSSPIASIDAAQIAIQQQPEVEKILRILPITLPGDGGNVNNGTGGVSTVDLRGLGVQRNLILVDGKRLTPVTTTGIVDTSQVPTALIERVDLVTGGASAVYGSDAMSGAINFILKRNFEGVDASYDFKRTGEKDGRIHSAAVTMGANVDSGKGNVVMHVNYTEREGVQLGKRPLGQLGIATADGSGLANFKAGIAPTAPPAGCGGTGSVATGGSTTTLPTRVGIAGGPGLGQFRDDGTLGANCSVFNFNPFNYYQTPLERFSATSVAHYEINDHVELYGRATFTSTNVRQQIAPSGVFGDPFFTPLANPFLSAQARASILTTANAGRVAGTVSTTGALPNWRDVNANGVVDVADDLLISYRRRTVEFGERSTTFDTNAFQVLFGAKGDLIEDWSYDVSVQHGESDQSQLNAGYTNIANIANAVNAVSTTTCRTGGAACVPINFFGGEGAITPAMAAYSSASALRTDTYEQTVMTASVSGPVAALVSPFADEPVAFAFGTEYREEASSIVTDECLKLQPASCLGGRGGATAPTKGAFDVSELFAEVIVPLAADKPFFKQLDLEAGYRWSEYNLSGVNRTWKVGLNWRPVDEVLVRFSKQKAARAPNIDELFAPVVTSLNNATLDPCSIGNAAARTDAALRARCIATGMTAAQVGTVEDIVSGQVNTFSGADLNARVTPEQADTITIGLVLTPELGVFRDARLSVDYYDIKIEDFIGTFSADEIFTSCYTQNNPVACQQVVRIGGGLTLPGSGLRTLTRNLNYMQAEGVEVDASFGIELEDLGADASWGRLTFGVNANWYLTHEILSDGSLALTNCVGGFGSACDAGGNGLGNPIPELRFVQRGSWEIGDLNIGYTWRYLGEVTTIAPKNLVFDGFETIPAFNYIDLNAQYQITDNVKVLAGVTNVFDRDPPVVGNEAGATSANSGNTFPSMYDTLGRVYSVGVNFRF